MTGTRTLIAAMLFFVVGIAVGAADAASLQKRFVPAPQAAPAPELSFTTPDGRTLGLADFRGKVLVVNYWATWCAPCVEELPALGKLRDKLGGPDFDVVAISVDREGASVVAPFLDKLVGKSLEVYLDPKMAGPRAVSAPGLPISLVIDRDGKVLGRAVGSVDWAAPDAEALLRGFMG